MLSIMDGLPIDWSIESGFKSLDQAVGKGGTGADIAEAGLQLACLLLLKNAAYGDSALAPTEVFARGMTPGERLAVRMDDKISRICRGSAVTGENERVDLAGYLLLDYIAAHRVDAPRVYEM